MLTQRFQLALKHWLFLPLLTTWLTHIFITIYFYCKLYSSYKL